MPVVERHGYSIGWDILRNFNIVRMRPTDAHRARSPVLRIVKSLELEAESPASGDHEEGEPVEVARTSGPAVPSVRCQAMAYLPPFSQEKATR